MLTFPKYSFITSWFWSFDRFVSASKWIENEFIQLNPGANLRFVKIFCAFLHLETKTYTLGFAYIHYPIAFLFFMSKIQLIILLQNYINFPISTLCRAVYLSNPSSLTIPGRLHSDRFSSPPCRDAICGVESTFVTCWITEKNIHLRVIGP